MITEEKLREREQWERCAYNAYDIPDAEVLEMIGEIRELRSKISGLVEFVVKELND